MRAMTIAGRENASTVKAYIIFNIILDAIAEYWPQSVKKAPK